LNPWSLPLPPAVYQIVCQIFCLWACDLAVDQADFQNVGVRGGVQRVDCRIRGVPDGWIKLHLCSLCLPPVQLTELIFKLLVFAPALGAVYQANFYNVGACACDRRSEAE